MPKPSNCGFRGVKFEEFRGLNGKYRVTCTNPTNGRTIHGGYYDTAEEAARRADELNIELWGSPGAVPCLNFPEEARKKHATAKKAAGKSAEPINGEATADNG